MECNQSARPVGLNGDYQTIADINFQYYTIFFCLCQYSQRFFVK